MSANEEDQKAATQKLLNEFVEMATKGDADAGFYLAELFLGELPTENINLLVAVTEVLIQQSVQLGSKSAQEYLQETWPQMKPSFMRRLIRRGLKE